MSQERQRRMLLERFVCVLHSALNGADIEDCDEGTLRLRYLFFVTFQDTYLGAPNSTRRFDENLSHHHEGVNPGAPIGYCIAFREQTNLQRTLVTLSIL